MFPGDAERLAAGTEDPHAGGGGDHRLNEFCDARDEVLAVVQEQQHLAAAEVFHEAVPERQPGVFADAQGRGDGRRDLRGISERCQLDHPGAVQAVGEEVGGNL